MFRKVNFYESNTASVSKAGSSLLIPGIFLILFGLVIIAMPELLVAMIAGTFISIGILLVLLSLKTKALRKF